MLYAVAEAKATIGLPEVIEPGARSLLHPPLQADGAGQRVLSAERSITTEEPIADTESAVPEIHATVPGSIEGTEPPETTPTTGQPTPSLLNDRNPLTREQGVHALIEFRDTVIRTEVPD